MSDIRIRSARTHNLKGIDLSLPRDRLIVITGLSGSGKSSLAFDTIYAEGQRRYVESLSAYARQFLSVMSKPDVDHIEGLSPAIAIEQRSASHNPRSTVATVTEIYDYMRLLFARAGVPRCPVHQRELAAQTISEMVDEVLRLPERTAINLMAPVVRNRKGEHRKLFADLVARGFVRARVDGEVCEMDDPPELDLRRNHTIEVVVDRLRVREELRQRLAESFETALTLTGGVALVGFIDDGGRADVLFSSRFACPMCDFAIPEMEPRLFSFNNPAGACESLRRTGLQAVLRSGTGGPPPPQPCGRRRARLGPPQRLVLLHPGKPGAALRVRPGGAFRIASRKDPPGRAVRQRANPDQVHLPLPDRSPVQPHAAVRGRSSQHGAALPRNGIGAGARGTVALPRLHALPGLRRGAVERGGPQRAGVEALDRRTERDERRGSA